MRKVFILGAGTMGLDIAQVFAAAGLEAAVRDVSEKILDGAAARLDKGLNKRVARGKLAEADRDALRKRIVFTPELSAAADADLVVEAIVEDAEIKKQAFAALDQICPPACIFATNTSSISITEIAAATERADRCVGMHFFNPATVMKLVELIRGAKTSDGTVEAVRALCVAAGKEPIEVAEAPGFVVNRLLIPMINEACFLVERGVASPEAVDTAMKLGANHPMGPLAIGDLVGLDVCLAIMDSLFAETHDSKYRACGLMRKLVRAGLLGRKTGKGFFTYDV